MQTAPVVIPTQTKKWTGDLDEILTHRLVRVAVPYSKTFFYTVKGVPWGVAYEDGTAFEAYLNKKYPQKKNIKIQVMFFVTPRDKVVQNLNDGVVDLVIGGLTITPERQQFVDFSEPTVSNSNEIVVTGPNSPRPSSLEDLAGKEVFVRKTSSYWEHLEGLNERFVKENKVPIKLTAVPEDLGDEDLLEMVNAGLLPTIVVNDWTTKLWDRVLTKIQVHTNLVIASGEPLAWAARKNSPKFLADINAFVKKNRQGTKFGDQLLARYTESTYMLKQAISPEGMKRFEEMAETFRKYGSKYQMDYLLMMAKGYQESGLNQNARSPVGAIGIMQLMPATGKEMNVGDITKQEPNIHAGVKYSELIMEKYYGNEPMDDLNKVLFSFAAYDCGPERVKQLRAEAAKKGLDPNVWSNNVEVIAAARIGSETVNYVSNIYKYYVAYKLIAVQEEQREKAKESLENKPTP